MTTIYEQGAVIGWISDCGCESARCRVATAQGRPFHAIPAGHKTLPDYHFATAAEAEAAVREVA